MRRNAITILHDFTADAVSANRRRKWLPDLSSACVRATRRRFIERVERENARSRVSGRFPSVGNGNTSKEEGSLDLNRRRVKARSNIPDGVGRKGRGAARASNENCAREKVGRGREYAPVSRVKRLRKSEIVPRMPRQSRGAW